MKAASFKCQDKEKMSAAAGIRTRAMSLEGSDPNQLDHSCTENPLKQ